MKGRIRLVSIDGTPDKTVVQVEGEDGEWHQLLCDSVRLEFNIHGSKAVITTSFPNATIAGIDADIKLRDPDYKEEECKVCEGTGEIPLATGTAPCDCKRK